MERVRIELRRRQFTGRIVRYFAANPLAGVLALYFPPQPEMPRLWEGSFAGLNRVRCTVLDQPPREWRVLGVADLYEEEELVVVEFILDMGVSCREALNRDGPRPYSVELFFDGGGVCDLINWGAIPA